MTITYKPIGVIKTPFKNIEGMPIQPAGAKGIKGSVEIFDEFADGLQDLDGFSHIILLYHFHRAEGYSLHVTPFLDDHPRGLFSTRAPKRPNGIGISVVELKRVEHNVLHIENVDILDGTPLLDIKPYIPDFDCFDAEKMGWYQNQKGKVHRTSSDKRFE
jgi:tRNA-Thr(GGU) m(6)t(6)A37 methyltransferase TsaA